MLRRTATVVAATLLLAACGERADAPAAAPVAAQDTTGTRPRPSAREVARSQAAPPGEPGVLLLAAGDIGVCGSTNDEATASLLDDHPSAAIATLGDNAYERGTDREFRDCYGPSWGRHRSRSRPAPGNHDYATRGGAGYHRYFGAAAGRAGQGWYSYEAGPWHAVVLNTNCGVVSCRAGSAQERWLRADLRAHAATRCTVAYFHHPRFSSGGHGPTTAVAPLFQALYDGGVDLVLAGHDHDYERFAPMNPSGQVDEARGIRSFVVGTGGAGLRVFRTVVRGSEARATGTWGVLALRLGATDYEWEFLRATGAAFSDSGYGACH